MSVNYYLLCFFTIFLYYQHTVHVHVYYMHVYTSITFYAYWLQDTIGFYIKLQLVLKQVTLEIDNINVTVSYEQN